MKRTLIIAFLAITLIAGSMLNSPSAGATTTEKYIQVIHEDFLFRSASSSEVTYWTAYLGTHTRGQMVSAVLNGSEFETLWVAGASGYYLGGPDSQFSAIVTNLASNGNFAASEVALIAGPTYFANAGSTNSGFVQKVYDDVLLRTADPSGLSYWVGRLNAGTSTRNSLASSIIRSTESANRRVSGHAGLTECPTITLDDAISLAAGSYCIVLDRLADATGETHWVGQLSGSAQLPSLWASLASSSEYLTNAGLRP